MPGQNTSSGTFRNFETSKRPSADETGKSAHFSKRPESNSDGSKNDDLSHGHAGLDAWTDRNPQSAWEGGFATSEEAPDDTFGTAPDTGPDDADTASTEFGLIPNDTRVQVERPASPVSHEIPNDLSVPHWLRRSQPEPPPPRQDGKWADTYLSDDDAAFIASGKFK